MKVFCIGFNKCGTTSLHELFIKNELRSIHNSSWWYWKDKEKFNHSDCFTDGYERYTSEPVFPDLKHLEDMFPDAKFILQTRNLNQWLVSRLKHGVSQKTGRRAGKPPFGAGRHVYTTGLKHCKLNNETIMRWVKDRNYWYDHVYEYFKNKNNLLIVDICDPDIVYKINKFLKINDNNFPFKKNNKTTNNRLKKYEKTIIKKINLFLEKYVVTEDHKTTWTCRFILNS